MLWAGWLYFTCAEVFLQFYYMSWDDACMWAMCVPVTLPTIDGVV